MKFWFYLISASSSAKAPESQLGELVSKGVIRAGTLVWSEGMTRWQEAGEVLSPLFASCAATPPPIPDFLGKAAVPLKSDDVDYEVFGDDMQIVEIELDPGETVVAEAGSMCYMEEGITFEAKMGDGSSGGGFLSALAGMGKRLITGESLFMTHFTHTGSSGKRRVAFAAPTPGKIVPLQLSELGGEILCEKGAFLCASRGTSVGVAFTQKFGAGLFGGEGFILQRLRGDGLAFLHAGGTIVRRELKGETLRLDTGCLVAMTSDVEYDIQRAGGLKSMLFGGEGLFLATLRGHGTVWIQSLPFSRMADRILANAPRHGGRSSGEGSILGGIGRALDGN